MVYLDHAALTPILPEVLAVMTEAAASSWGNPDSRHAAGRRARSRVEDARAEVAALLGSVPGAVRFCVDGTRALALAVELALANRRGPLALSRIEHPSLLRLAEKARAGGREVRWLASHEGGLDLEELAALPAESVLAVGALNHELGTAPDLASVAGAAGAALLVIDAVQAAAWLDLSALAALEPIVVVAAQKMGGAPGAAAVSAPRRFPLRHDDEEEPVGWLDLVGFGEACRLARARGHERRAVARGLTQTLLEEIRRVCPDARHNGAGAAWAGTILDVSFPGVLNGDLTSALDLEGVCVARGSACLRQTTVGSAVVAAAYPGEPWRAATATRWSAGFDTTADDVAAAARVLRRIWDALPRRHELLAA